MKTEKLDEQKLQLSELAAELRLVKPTITANFGGVHVDIGRVANAAADELDLMGVALANAHRALWICAGLVLFELAVIVWFGIFASTGG